MPSYGLFWLICVSICEGANILGAIPTVSYSHQVAYQQLWKELSLRGHKVTVLTTNPLKDATLVNLTEIDLGHIYEKIEARYNRLELVSRAKHDILGTLLVGMDQHNFALEEGLNDPHVKDLINGSGHKFDVVLAEFLHPAMYAFSHVYKCPLISLSSMDIPSTVYNARGNPIHPATHPDVLLLHMIPPLDFVERLISTLFTAFLSVYAKYIIIPRDDLVIKKHFGDGVPSLLELREKVDLTFVNINPVFHTIKPLVPSIVPVPGLSNFKSIQHLPKELEDFLQGADKGFIYFSLGSNVRRESLGNSMVNDIVEVFESLPYKVLWKVDTNSSKPLSDKFYLAKWLPQQTILQHPKIKLFITQGGQQSLDEAVYNCVPILGIPFYGDQHSNIKKAVARGMALSLDYTSMTKQSFKSAVSELIENPKYRNKVNELSDLVRDQPMTSLELAVWWTEYVIRHKGAHILRSPFIDLPAYQYYQIDVIGFCVVVAFVLIFLTVKVFKLIIRCCTRHNSDVKQKRE